MDGAMEKIVTIIVAIIGVATLAVLVSKRSNTSGVISSAGSAIGGLLGVALSPITGGGVAMNGFSGINSVQLL